MSDVELWLFPTLTRLRSTCAAPTGKRWGLMVVLVNIVRDPTEEPVGCNVPIQLCWFRGRIMFLGVIQAFTISHHHYLCHKSSECLQEDLSSPVSGHDFPGLIFLGFSKVNYPQCLTYGLLTSIFLRSLNITISLFLPITLDNWELSLSSKAFLPDLNPNPTDLQC